MLIKFKTVIEVRVYKIGDEYYVDVYERLSPKIVHHHRLMCGKSSHLTSNAAEAVGKVWVNFNCNKNKHKEAKIIVTRWWH